MNNTKIQFSENELNIATDKAFILTKNRIIEKVYNLFGLLADRYTKLAAQTLPPEVLNAPPKISRGENYNELPYVMLDYPRAFSKKDIFAVRTMFWWGNELSFTLHLKGKFRAAYQNKLPLFSQYTNPIWYLQLSENEWLHHKTQKTHKSLRKVNATEAAEYGMIYDFTKIACFHSLRQWNSAIQLFEKDFTTIVKTLC